LFLVALSAGTLTDAFAQPSGNHMCGDGTNQTYFVDLPAVDDSPGGGLVFPLATLGDDAVQLPKGCDIYLLIVSGIGRNRNFNELLFYPLAKYVAEHNGYVHYAWWNNLLQPYMSGPLHPINQNDLLGLGNPLTANHHPGKRYSRTASLVAPLLGFDDERDFEVYLTECQFTNPSAKPVIGSILQIAGSAGCAAVKLVADVFFDPQVRRPFPDNTMQTVVDIQRFVKVTREQNPNAVIVVAGHGLGGHVAADASLSMAGDPISNRIDLLALIDPYSSWEEKDGSLFIDGGFDGLASRSMSRRFVIGYARRDCVRDAFFRCKYTGTFFDREYECYNRNEILSNEPIGILSSFAPLSCPGPAGRVYQNRQIFAKHVYHRWQNETGPPTDFSKGQGYKHIRPGGMRAFETTSLFPTTFAGPHFGGHMCADPARTDEDSGFPCSPFDGHDELVGFRAVRSHPLSFLNFSLNVDLRVPLGVAAKNWPSTETGRYNAMIDMASPDPDNNWEHRPAAPQLCRVCDDLVAITRSLYEERNPPEPETDETAPVTTANPSPAPNAEGWNTTDVIVELEATDAGSGVQEIEHSLSGAETAGTTVTSGATASRTLMAEGTTTLSFRARDEDGNEEALGTLEVQIDRTRPSITAHAAPLPNGNGWHRGAVEVSYTASDALSGLLSSSGPETVSTEGLELEILGTAEDKAGNTGSASVVLNIDLTPPGIARDSRLPAPNGAGWNNSPVTVKWNCTDALSGPVAAVDSVTVASDGLAQSATGTCRDAADHVTTDSVEGINIDTAPPNVAVSHIAPNGNGWHNTDVVVRFEASDALSEIAFSSPDTIVSTEGSGQPVSGSATDNAGNTAVASTVLNIDKTAPTIALSSRTPANAAGWNNTDVALTWNCSDAVSGPVANQVSASLTGEGEAQNATGNCADRAGHTSSQTQSGINIDKTSPISQITTPANDAVYLLNAIVNAAYGCADALSGVTACAGTVGAGAAVDTATVGDKTFSVSVADAAGNQSAASHSYTVQYAFSGFSNPIAAMPAMNTAKAGKTVPVKYSLRDVNNASISDLTSFVSLVSAPVACDTNVPTAAAEETDGAGSTTIHFDSGQFIYNWKTQSAWQGTCRVLQLTLKDGTRHMVTFQFK
jgi:hypothetical protein